MRRRVAKGRAARDRRYESAVRRQIDMVARSEANGRPYLYADAEELLRRGDNLERFVCPPPYFCPTSGKTECCPRHSGWGTCCARPDLHRPMEE